VLFMVIERFNHGEAEPVGERFRREERILPEGLTYHAGWVDLAGTRCFQLMESQHPQSLTTWICHWDDLVDFEIVPVLTSGEFWPKPQSEQVRSELKGCFNSCFLTKTRQLIKFGQLFVSQAFRKVPTYEERLRGS
jgi:Protein of unknown function (DUF3303)